MAAVKAKGSVLNTGPRLGSLPITTTLAIYDLMYIPKCMHKVAQSS